MDQVYGAGPSKALNVTEYGAAVKAFGNTAALVICGMPIKRSFVALCLLWGSKTITVKGYVPAAVAIPLITPVFASSDKPLGRLPEVMDHVFAVLLPELVSCAE